MRWLIAIGEFALMCWFVAIGCEAIFQRLAGMRSPFKMGEFHHAYLGIGVVVLGFVLASVTGCLVQLLGVVVTADDVYQHQVQTLNGYVEYRSPLHQLFARYLWPLPIVQWLVRQLDRWWVAGVVLGLLAVWLLGCAPSRLVPMVPRPDTRFVAGVFVEQSIGLRSLELLQAALPKEGSLCYYGIARDTVINGVPMQLLVPARVEVAHSDSSNEFFVWYPRNLPAGCARPGLIGIAHSHPYAAEPWACTHSDPDAYVLFANPAALFSIVFCGDGRLEVMYQDGRRVPDRWRQ